MDLLSRMRCHISMFAKQDPFSLVIPDPSYINTYLFLPSYYLGRFLRFLWKCRVNIVIYTYTNASAYALVKYYQVESSPLSFPRPSKRRSAVSRLSWSWSPKACMLLTITSVNQLRWDDMNTSAKVVGSDTCPRKSKDGSQWDVKLPPWGRRDSPCGVMTLSGCVVIVDNQSFNSSLHTEATWCAWTWLHY